MLMNYSYTFVVLNLKNLLHNSTGKSDMDQNKIYKLFLFAFLLLKILTAQVYILVLLFAIKLDMWYLFDEKHRNNNCSYYTVSA